MREGGALCSGLSLFGAPCLLAPGLCPCAAPNLPMARAVQCITPARPALVGVSLSFLSPTWAGLLTAHMKLAIDIFGHLFILLTLIFIVYGQLVIKWQMGGVGPLPQDHLDKVTFLMKQLMNPWIFSGFVSAFLASLAWMAAMTRFPLNYAYPFMSLAFVIVMILGVLFLGEVLNLRKVLGSNLFVNAKTLVPRNVGDNLKLVELHKGRELPMPAG